MKTFLTSKTISTPGPSHGIRRNRKKLLDLQGFLLLILGVPYLVVKNSLFCGDARHVLCGYYTHGKNKEFCVILNACLKSLREVHKSWAAETMIIQFYPKKISCFWHTSMSRELALFPLSIWPVNRYCRSILCTYKKCGNFLSIMLIEYSSMGTCAHQFST